MKKLIMTTVLLTGLTSFAQTRDNRFTEAAQLASEITNTQTGNLAETLDAALSKCNIAVEYNTNQKSSMIMTDVKNVLARSGYSINPQSLNKMYLKETSGAAQFTSTRVIINIDLPEIGKLNVYADAQINLLTAAFNPDKAAANVFKKATERALREMSKVLPKCN